MRAYEFIIEYIETDDIGKYQLAELHRELLKNLPLYESIDAYQKVKILFENFDKTPIIGQSYFPISLSTVPIGNLISIAETTKVGILEKIDPPNLYFDFGSGLKKFPYNLEGGDSLQHTILCETIDEQEKFIDWVLLSFDNTWRILRKKI